MGVAYGIDPNGTPKALKVDEFGAQDVNIQDQHTLLVDLYLHEHIETLPLTADTSIGDTTVTVTDLSATIVGHLLCFKENGRFSQIGIVTITGTGPWDLVLESPLDYAYTTAGFCGSTTKEANVNGSITPVIYHISPPSGTQWDITRLMFYLQDNVAMDDAKFGGISALTKGIVLRKKDTIYQNLFNVKSNGEFALRAYDRTYGDKAPAGSYSMFCRRTFAGQSKNGITIRLDGDTSDDLELIIQDDLTGLEKFHIVCQGHVVKDS